MKLLFLTRQNLADRLFVRDFVFNFSFEEKAILVHEPFGGTVKDTRFVTKRLSALLSEAMVYNNAFGADQRGLVQTHDDGSLIINRSLIESLLSPIRLLVLGPVLSGADGPYLGDARTMALALKNQLPIDETFVFTANPLSPLGSKRPLIDTAEDKVPLEKAYEEELETLALALALRPARIANPSNYAQ